MRSAAAAALLLASASSFAPGPLLAGPHLRRPGQHRGRAAPLGVANPVRIYVDYARQLYRQPEPIDTVKDLYGPSGGGAAGAPLPAAAQTKKKAAAGGGARNLKTAWATGLSMGVVYSAWIFSGNVPFAVLHYVQCFIAQLEYYKTVLYAGGSNPARKISLISTAVLFGAACLVPALHELVFPMSCIWVMLYFLTIRPEISTIADISTTFLGMLYTGYMPSFWIRLRRLGTERVTRASTAALALRAAPRASLPRALQVLPRCLLPPASAVTSGAMTLWWTCTSIVISDVCAYFGGKNFGRTKLAAVSKAAGRTSPNKTVEGVLFGMLGCSAFMLCGAWALSWPRWYLTGPLYGVLLSFVALVGDLTASMFKRDAGVKDFGSLLPEHGGLLDRMDSFMITAPACFVFVTRVLPAFGKMTC